MRKPGPQLHTADQPVATDAETQEALAEGGLAPSKTRRKAEMHALQELGEAMVLLSSSRLAVLALPERLADAVAEARHITRWEARRRQMQFIGRLMRDIDPQPIQAQLDQWAGGPNAENARLASVERWRVRLMSESTALDLLCSEYPAAERPRLEPLITRARAERASAQAEGASAQRPHAYRELFRLLNTLITPR